MSQNQTDTRGDVATTRRGTVAALTLLALGLTVVAAGCGGGSSDEQANEAYANSVCSAISGWSQQMKSIATTFTGTPSKATLQAKVNQAVDATKSLATQIKAVPPPDTSQGQAAKQQLEQLSTDAQTTTSAAQSAVNQLGGNPSAADIGVAVVALAPQVENLVSTAKSAVTTLKDASGSLGSAFKSADSCKSLG
jgi:hypothetical protein